MGINSAPIVTVDGVEMTQGMKVFQARRDYQGGSIRALTVVALSRVNRYIILKCARGCEEKIRLTDGCSYGITNIPFSTVEAATEALRSFIAKETENNIKSSQESLVKYTQQLAELPTMNWVVE